MYMLDWHRRTGFQPVSISFFKGERLEACPALECWRSVRRISTEREEEPESIHTSSVSTDLVAASGPAQSGGFTAAHRSFADFSNQTLEPCLSIKSAAFRTILAAT